jgi:hypothetical protein
MSSQPYADAYMQQNVLLGSSKESGQVTTKFRLEWSNLICPANGSVAHNLHTAQAFEVFRWMCNTAKRFHKDHERDPRSVLSHSSGHGGTIHPICLKTWKEDLRARFLDCMLSPFAGRSVREWRAAIDMFPGKSRVVPVRHYKDRYYDPPLGCATTARTLDSLWNAVGQRVNYQPNEFHRHARWITNVLLIPLTHGWGLAFQYSYKGDDHSSWQIDVAKQERKETFVEFLMRAHKAAGELLLNPDSIKVKDR